MYGTNVTVLSKSAIIKSLSLTKFTEEDKIYAYHLDLLHLKRAVSRYFSALSWLNKEE